MVKISHKTVFKSLNDILKGYDNTVVCNLINYHVYLCSSLFDFCCLCRFHCLFLRVNAFIVTGIPIIYINTVLSLLMQSCM